MKKRDVKSAIIEQVRGDKLMEGKWKLLESIENDQL